MRTVLKCLPSLSLPGRRVSVLHQLPQHGRGGLLPVAQRQLLPVSHCPAAAGLPSAARLRPHHHRGQRDVTVRSGALPLLGALLHWQGRQGDDVQGAGPGGAPRQGAQLLSRWEEPHNSSFSSLTPQRVCLSSQVFIY